MATNSGIFGIYYYLIADILTKLLQKCFLSVPVPYVTFLLSPLNLIGYHGNQKANSSEAVWGIKIKLCRIVSNISLYKKYWFLLPLLKHYGCYGNLKFSSTYNRKSEN